jgi:hypothetical protein
LYCYQLTANAETGHQMQQEGNVKIEITFKTAPKIQLTCVILSQCNNAVLTINKSREVDVVSQGLI